jgi:hypothetical protein
MRDQASSFDSMNRMRAPTTKAMTKKNFKITTSTTSMTTDVITSTRPTNITSDRRQSELHVDRDLHGPWRAGRAGLGVSFRQTVTLVVFRDVFNIAKHCKHDRVVEDKFTLVYNCI